MNWNELIKLPPEDILGWASEQPWCKAMSSCVQDEDWHSEGDVWTHTQMVCRELLTLEEWLTLNLYDRDLLFFTALLHDSAKPLTSQIDPESGRLSSPKHAVRGESLARSVLRDLNCDLTTREEIAKLVRYHGRPVFLLDKPVPEHEVISLSWLVNNRLLYLFALADFRGRDANASDRKEENLEFWKLAAEENDCFEKPYQFPNAKARFQFYRDHQPNLHYIPHEDYSCDVTMMAGLPGSGKDTWLKTFDGPIVSLDDIRSELDVDATDNQGNVIQVAQEKCRELLRNKTSFAFNATNLLRQTRKKWIDIFANYNARIKLVYLEPPISVILRQNKQREKSVPDQVIHNLARKYEPPTWTEAHELQLVSH